MPSEGSITRWLSRFSSGDREVVGNLWQRYYPLLVGLARQRLHAAPRRAADEDDVALSAFDSFCRGVEQGRFPRLDDRDDLWQVLVLLTVRKAADLARYESRDRRDWRRVQEETTHGDPTTTGGNVLVGLLSREPDPAFAAEVAEECRRLLACLGDDQLRVIALSKMEGYTNDEIAAQIGCSPPTIERRLHLIRKRWEKEIGG
jgi:RNA polymerase sigma factor (sigma-70 family)